MAVVFFWSITVVYFSHAVVSRAVVHLTVLGRRLLVQLVARNLDENSLGHPTLGRASVRDGSCSLPTHHLGPMRLPGSPDTKQRQLLAKHRTANQEGDSGFVFFLPCRPLFWASTKALPLAMH